MRIVLIGVSHWHTPFYSEPVLAMPDAAIVGVSDPDAGRAAPLGEYENQPPLFIDGNDVAGPASGQSRDGDGKLPTLDDHSNPSSARIALYQRSLTALHERAPSGIVRPVAEPL